ncbi:MAG: HAD-IA family hydrolase [Anaerolineales bacterium]
MIQALIFDFDGLILDTEIPGLTAWQEIYAEDGADLSMDLWGQVVGGTGFTDFEPAAHLEELTRRPLDHQALQARWLRRCEELTAPQPFLPGVLDYLTEAPRLGLHLAIASSSPHAWVDAHLARLGLSAAFEVIVCAEDVAQVKPNPDLCLAALAFLAIRPEEAVVLEDSPNGVKAAKAAGLRAVAVPNAVTSQLQIEGADVVLDSLAALPLTSLLNRLGDPLGIRPETPRDVAGIRSLHGKAFGHGREADLVDLIRAHHRAALSLVAVNGGEVLGHLLFSKVVLQPQPWALRGLGLGPVAVLPEFQRRGIGSRLIRAGLELCREQGYDFVVLLGDPAYYRRFRFQRACDHSLENEYGADHEFMVLELQPGALAKASGQVEYPPEFKATGC